MIRKNLLLLAFVSIVGWMQAQDAENKAYIYTTNMKINGQDMAFDVVRSYETEDGNLIITDKTATPFGNSENISVVDAEDFRTISQSSTGFMTTNFDFTEDKIVGESADFRGNKTPVNLETEGVVYGGGSAMEMYLKNLPLEVGYETTISTFNPFEMNVVEMQLEVTEDENVEVPAGNFEVFRLDLTVEDKEDFQQSIWMTADEPHMMVKSVMSGQQFGEITTVYAGTKEKKEKKKKKKGKN
ncbi:MAG: DUF3108 domain-containing protein [Bacteroidota bacterium]